VLGGFGVWRSLCSCPPMGMMDIRAGAVPSANAIPFVYNMEEDRLLLVRVPPQQLAAAWIGYRIHPLYRAFGMAATGYLNVGLLAFALWKALAG
jgi:hypothetical protein